MHKLLAQGNDGGTSLGTLGSGGGFGAVNDRVTGITTATGAMGAVSMIVSRVIGFLTLAGFLWFFFQLIIAGISWITAGGEKNKLTEARERLTNAFLGLVIVVAGWAILALASSFFGVDFTSPTTIIENLQLK
jgi:hypothetical protein